MDVKSKAKTISYAALLSVILGTAACAPMEQAPLVYSSTQTIGVEVSAGEPESPAFDLVIGYSGKDRAFVPVAVSKFCRARTPSYEDCLDAIFGLQIIKGDAQVDGQQLSKNNPDYYTGLINEFEAGARETKEIIASLERTKKAISRIPNLKSEIQKTESRIDQLTKPIVEKVPASPTVIAVTEALQTTDPSAEPSVLSETQEARTLTEAEAAELDRKKALLPKLKSDLSKLEGLKANNPEIEEDIQSQRNAKSAFEKKIKKAQEDRQAVQLQADRFNMDSKKDALSVYGSFDGNARGDNKSASIGVGKVFSTGVAAQNITQGINRASVASAGALCLREGGALIEATFTSDADKLNAMKELFKICRTELPD